MWILLLFLASLLVAGCEKRGPELTIAVGGAPEEVRYWAEVIREFERREGIEVRILRQPVDTDLRRHGLTVALSAGEPDPDVFLMDIAWIGQFTASGWLEELRGIDTSPFPEEVLRVDRREGKLYALPVYVDCGLLYYRKDLLEKYACRVPRTWEELLDCSLRVQKAERKKNPDFYAFLWQGAQYEGLVCVFLEFSTGAGGGLEKVRSYENIKALTFMRDLIHHYGVSPPNTYTEMKEEEVRILFQSGNALFERNWPYAWKLHEAEDSPVRGRVGIAPLPAFEGGRRASCLGGWHIGVSRFSDMKESALKLLKFITSYEVQKGFALNLGWFPARKDVLKDRELLEKLPHLKDISEACSYAVPRPGVPYYVQLSEVLRAYLSAVLAAKMDPATALRKAEREIELLERTYR